MTDDTDDYEQEWEDLDEKVILAQILGELQHIRLLLSDAESDSSRDPGEGVYECTKCMDTTVPASKREQHAQSEHNAPPGMAEALFERVS